MKILFIRHGESKAQAKQIELNAPDSINGLTDRGIEQVKTEAHNFQGKIDAVYSSPYNRTQITARVFLQELGIDKPIIIDDRLREIDYGYHGGEAKNNEELTAVAIKQIAGDYEIRFGKTGENKREIVTRFFDFIIDVFNKHASDETLLVVSHGRAISIFGHEFAEINGVIAESGGTTNAKIKEYDLSSGQIANMIKRVEMLKVR